MSLGKLTFQTGFFPDQATIYRAQCFRHVIQFSQTRFRLRILVLQHCQISPRQGERSSSFLKLCTQLAANSCVCV